MERFHAMAALGFAVACTPAVSTPPAVIPAPVISAENVSTPSVSTQAWTRYESHRLWLPIREDEFDALEFEKPYVATLRNQVVWLNLDHPKARPLLAGVEGAVGVTLSDPDAEMLDEVDRLAARVSVAVSLYLSREEYNARIERLTHVQRLDAWVPGSDRLPALGTLQGLEELALTTDASDAASMLAGLPTRLTTLRVRGSLTPAVIPHLTRLTKLEVLHLPRLKDPVPLAGLSRMEELTYPLTDTTLQGLARLPHLEALHVVGCELSDQAVGQVGKLSALKRVSLTNCRPPDGLLAQIAALPRLEDFHADTNIRSSDIAALQAASRLTSLSLPWTIYSSEVAELLEKSPQLKGLDLKNSGFPNHAIDTLLGLRHLERLDIGGAGLSERNLAKLSQLKRLRVLIAHNTSANDWVLGEWVNELKDLRELDLDRTDVSAEGLWQLTQADELRWLRLPDHSINEASVDEINRARELVFLSFEKQDVSCEHARSKLRVPLLLCDGTRL